MTKNVWCSISVLAVLAVAGTPAGAQPGTLFHADHLDANGDGVVTTDEFVASALQRWAENDANEDGKVTFEEVAAKLEEHRKQRFLQRDADGDGVVERAEIEDMPEDVFRRLDADASGALSQNEFEGSLSLVSAPGSRGGALSRMPGDADQDGEVSEAEAAAVAQIMARRLDLNADGVLTSDELARGIPLHGGGALLGGR